MKVGDLVIYKGLAVGWTDEYDEYLPSAKLNEVGDDIPGVVLSLYCNCEPGEERWWLEGGCQCVADVLWNGDPIPRGHVTKHLVVLNEAR